MMVYVEEAKELSVLVGSHYFNCIMVNEEVGMDKFTLGSVFDGDCTQEEYAGQYKSTTLKVGETYVQHPATWQEMYYKILFIEDKVALGVAVGGCLGKESRRCLFYSDGTFTGWKYNDTARPSYRLQTIKELDNG